VPGEAQEEGVRDKDIFGPSSVTEYYPLFRNDQVLEATERHDRPDEFVFSDGDTRELKDAECVVERRTRRK
jgi:hypothetical protein